MLYSSGSVVQCNSNIDCEKIPSQPKCIDNKCSCSVINSDQTTDTCLINSDTKKHVIQTRDNVYNVLVTEVVPIINIVTIQQIRVLIMRVQSTHVMQIIIATQQQDNVLPDAAIIQTVRMDIIVTMINKFVLVIILKIETIHRTK